MNPSHRFSGIWTLLAVLLTVACSPEPEVASNPELERLAGRAARVTIIRDDFGVPHIYGKSDADAVFGLLYAHGDSRRWDSAQIFCWKDNREPV